MTSKSLASDVHCKTIDIRETIDLSSQTMRPGTWMQIRIPLPIPPLSQHPRRPREYAILEINCTGDKPHIYGDKDVPDFESFCDAPGAIPEFDCEEGEVPRKQQEQES